MRMFFTLILSMFLSFGFVPDSVAQISNPEDFDPNPRWCATGAGGEAFCGNSAEAACRPATESYYAGPRMAAYRGAQVQPGGRTAPCVVDRTHLLSLNAGNHEGQSTAGIECVAGRLQGGQCVLDDRSSCSHCEAGGVKYTGGSNPIDLISGIKQESVQDFVTADGRFMLNRSYASRTSGFSGTSAISSEIGRGWQLDLIPQLYLNQLFARGTFYLPGNQAESIVCLSGNCFENGNSFTGGGRPRLMIDPESSIHGRGFFQEQDNVSVIDKGGVRYTFRIGLVSGRFVTAIRKAEYPGGYTLNYKTTLESNTVTSGDTTVFVDAPRAVVTEITDNFGRKMTFSYKEQSWELLELSLIHI